MRDYSEKVGAVRESAERRPLPKNRPRKAPVGVFAFLGILLLLGGTYGAGVLTGWYLFRGELPEVASAPPAAAKPQETVPAAAQPGAAAPDAPLTFYKTLPSGGHGAMGSGVNLKLAEPPQPKSAPVAAPAAAGSDQKQATEKTAPDNQASEKQAAEKQAAQKPAADKPAADKPAADKPAAEKPAAARFLVQIASYRDRKEAEAVLAKLSAKGVAAYLVESKLGKGVWWRLRVGRHLSKEEADRLAAKVGSGATVLAE